MTEQVHSFGQDDSLIGIRTQPDPGSVYCDSPTILWLNAGLLHHVGPFGWYATLARRLASQGFVSFRFDLSGIGDSSLRIDGSDNLERGNRDVDAAMDFLFREFGATRFILVGLCAGAILAQRIASRNDRVTGVVLLDGWGRRTSGYYFRHYARRVFQWKPWVNAIRRLVHRVPRGGGGGRGWGGNMEDRRLLVREYFMEFPSPEQAREQLVTALRRGTHFLFIYTGGVIRYFNDRCQFAEMFSCPESAGGLIEVEYRPEADHLYSNKSHRQVMFDSVERWILSIA